MKRCTTPWRTDLIAVDTNILVYARRREEPQHEAATAALRGLAEGDVRWAIPVFVIAEFLRVTTHPRVVDRPDTFERAAAFLDEVFRSPSLEIIGPAERFWPLFKAAGLEGRARGRLVMDAQIVAVCREHGAKEILTEDRDFTRFGGIAVIPLEGYSPR